MTGAYLTCIVSCPRRAICHNFTVFQTTRLGAIALFQLGDFLLRFLQLKTFKVKEKSNSNDKTRTLGRLGFQFGSREKKLKRKKTQNSRKKLKLKLKTENFGIMQKICNFLCIFASETWEVIHEIDQVVAGSCITNNHGL